MMGNDDSKIDYTAPLSRIILGTATASDAESCLEVGLKKHAYQVHVCYTKTIDY